MGIYSHLTETQLIARRDRLDAALMQRLTGPTSASHNNRSVAYQQGTADLRRELDAVNAELDERKGRFTRRPIHVI